MTHYPLVVVRWHDAHGGGDNQYAPTDVPHAPLVVETVGWLLRSDEVGVSVACERVDGAEYRGHTFILRVLLISCEPVVKPRKPRKRPQIAEVPS